MSIDYFLFKEQGNEIKVDQIIHDLADQIPNHKIEYYFSHKRYLITDSAIVVLVQKDDLVLGIMVLNHDKFDMGSFVTIETIFLAEKYQQKNIGFILVSKTFQEFMKKYNYFPDFIVTKTANPVTYSMMKNINDHDKIDFYPSLDLKNSDRMKIIARKLTEKIAPDKKFNLETGVIIQGGGFISNDFWKTKPLSRQNSVNEYFDKYLVNLDRLLCIVKCDQSEVKKIIIQKLGISNSLY